MNPHDIAAALRKKGSSQRAIATACEVSVSTVSHVVHGRGKSRKVAEAISKVTGIPVQRLWPTSYEMKKAA